MTKTYEWLCSSCIDTHDALAGFLGPHVSLADGSSETSVLTSIESLATSSVAPLLIRPPANGMPLVWLPPPRFPVMGMPLVRPPPPPPPLLPPPRSPLLMKSRPRIVCETNQLFGIQFGRKEGINAWVKLWGKTQAGRRHTRAGSAEEEEASGLRPLIFSARYLNIPLKKPFWLESLVSLSALIEITIIRTDLRVVVLVVSS